MRNLVGRSFGSNQRNSKRQRGNQLQANRGKQVQQQREKKKDEKKLLWLCANTLLIPAHWCITRRKTWGKKNKKGLFSNHHHHCTARDEPQDADESALQKQTQSKATEDERKKQIRMSCRKEKLCSLYRTRVHLTDPLLLSKRRLQTYLLLPPLQ